jgi:proteasome assembly chaperone (PAC2) family protein
VGHRSQRNHGVLIMGMGTSGAAGAAPGVGETGDINSMGGGSMGGIDIMGMLGALFKDPESAKAVSKTLGNLATTVSSAGQIPPHAQAFLQASMKQQMRERTGADERNPYLGDITRFITPDVAKSVLRDFGVATSRSSL